MHSQHPSAAPSRTNDGLIQATVQQTSAFSRMGAIEAFQRLQAAQALQTANGNGQQGAVNYASCVDPAAFIGNGASIPDPMSLLAQTLNQRAATPNMHIKPSQVLGGNVYGGNQFMSMNMSDGDLGGSPWAFTPQGTMTPSPGTAVASPNNTYQDENIPGMGSYASSRSSSYHNLQSTPVAIVGDASSNVSLATSAPDVSQSPKKNRTQSQNAATTAPTPASITSGTGANGNQSAPATVCVNCKTTVSCTSCGLPRGLRVSLTDAHHPFYWHVEYTAMEKRRERPTALQRMSALPQTARLGPTSIVAQLCHQEVSPHVLCPERRQSDADVLQTGATEPRILRRTLQRRWAPALNLVETQDRLAPMHRLQRMSEAYEHEKLSSPHWRASCGTCSVANDEGHSRQGRRHRELTCLLHERFHVGRPLRKSVDQPLMPEPPCVHRRTRASHHLPLKASKPLPTRTFQQNIEVSTLLVSQPVPASSVPLRNSV